MVERNSSQFCKITTSSGLHGANRMASNSLLECFVYGMSAAKDIENKFDENSKRLVVLTIPT
jgi:aspartate oxidase